MKRPLSIAAIGAVVITVATGFAVLWKDHPGTAPANPQASSRQALGGHLLIEVPTGKLGDRYWLYVGKELISFPPHPVPDGKSPLSGPDEISTFDMGNLPATSFEVSLMTPGGDGAFPFSISSGKAELEKNGQKVTVQLTVPESHDEDHPGKVVSDPVVCGSDPRNWLIKSNQQLMQRYQDLIHDPVVHALSELQIAFSEANPVDDVSFVDMPSTSGGGRYYNADQIDKIVDAIRATYPSGYGDTSEQPCDAARESLPAAADLLVRKMKELDEQEDSLRIISKKLREAGRINPSRNLAPFAVR
jgi:hypothetical protein